MPGMGTRFVPALGARDVGDLYPTRATTPAPGPTPTDPITFVPSKAWGLHQAREALEEGLLTPTVAQA